MEFSAVDYQYHRHDAPDTEATFASKLMKVREKEGRCINKNCGIYTHRIKRRYLFLKKKVPLNVKGQVLDGRCLLCNPLRFDVEEEQRSCYSAPTMGVKETNYNLLTSTNSTDSNTAYMSSMSDQLSIGSAPSKMNGVSFLNRTSPRHAQIAPSLHDDTHRHSKGFHYSLPTDLLVQPLCELGIHSVSSGSRSSSRRKRSRSVEVLNAMNSDSEVEVISLCSSDSDSPRSVPRGSPREGCGASRPPHVICVDVPESHLTWQNGFKGASKSLRRFLWRRK